jgi:HEAT repeat protein
MGNRADPRDIPALAAALESEPDPMVREHVAWALEKFGDHPAARTAPDTATRAAGE